MPYSMTGYGIGEDVREGTSVRIEIRSINSRYFDFSARLPYSLAIYEAEIKKRIQAKVKRGKVSLFANVDIVDDTTSDTVIDEKKVALVVREIKKIGKKYGVSGDLELRDLVRIPDVFLAKQKKENPAFLKKMLLAVVDQALGNLISMKEKEAKHLVRDIVSRMKVIIKSVSTIEKIAAKEPQRLKEMLEERIASLTKKGAYNEERLEEYVAYCADKCDITEETVRLTSHCDMFQKTLASDGEVGKRLDFILQEMHREINTIGSKSQNSDISQTVIAVKSELEKIREQVQNIE